MVRPTDLSWGKALDLLNEEDSQEAHDKLSKLANNHKKHPHVSYVKQQLIQYLGLNEENTQAFAEEEDLSVDIMDTYCDKQGKNFDNKITIVNLSSGYNGHVKIEETDVEETVQFPLMQHKNVLFVYAAGNKAAQQDTLTDFIRFKNEFKDVEVPLGNVITVTNLKDDWQIGDTSIRIHNPQQDKDAQAHLKQMQENSLSAIGTDIPGKDIFMKDNKSNTCYILNSGTGSVQRTVSRC